MANFNKCIFIGRLTADPELKAIGNGSKVAKLRFVTNNRKKVNGEWADDPCFLDCDVFNRGETGKLADFVADKCRKGSQLLVEGKLYLEQWDDKNGGGKRSKHKLVVDNVQLLDAKQPPPPATANTAANETAEDYANGGSNDVPF